ncbi:MAG: MFS transporter [Comamonadaceae bacterium]|nr:MFS transporter [Comamonadaceae bacterium]
MDTPRTFCNRDFLLALFGYFFLFMAVSLFFLFPVVLQSYGSSQSRIGLIMGVYSVVAIAIRPLFGRMIDLRGGKRFAILGALLLVVTTPLFHFVRDAGWLPLALRSLAGIGWGVSMTATISMCSDLAPVDRLAKSMGVIGVAGLVANAIGPLLAEELLRGGRPRPSLRCEPAVPRGCAGLPRANAGGHPAGLRRPARGGRALRAVPWVLAAIIAGLPVFHGAIRGAMIYFIAVFGHSVGIARVGTFFLVFSLAAILTRFRLGDLSDRRGGKRSSCRRRSSSPRTCSSSPRSAACRCSSSRDSSAGSARA